MPKAKTSDATFMELFEAHGAAKTSEILDVNLRHVYSRRERLEKRLGRQIVAGGQNGRATRVGACHDARTELAVRDGVILVGSDAHYWPHVISTAHRAFVKFCKKLKPKIVILNGDVLDGAGISRFAPIGWEHRPSLIGEIEACKERLGEIESAVDGNCKRVWTLGNHDGRFETRLATVAPEYAKIHGVHLKDHFPLWEPAWSCWVNDTVIKHRFKGGIHATHNNTIWAGKTMVTGHLHSLKVTPFSDYNGTRFGVDTGTLAEPNGPQFVDYTEDNPKNHRSGFAVLTYRDGRLMWPELVHVFEDGKVEFRGEIIEV